MYDPFTYRSSSAFATQQGHAIFCALFFSPTLTLHRFIRWPKKNPRDFEVKNGSASIDSAIESILGW